MKTTLAVTLLVTSAFVLYAPSIVCAQTAAKPEFEVASVKQVASAQPGAQTAGGMRATGHGVMHEDADRITYQGVTLNRMLLRAYDLKPYQMSGPAWLDDEHYDVVATFPEGTAKEQISAMLQNLLTERFRITLHSEMKEEPTYILAVAKGGSKLKPAAEDNPRSPMGFNFSSQTGDMKYVYRAQTMTQFADALSRDLGRNVTDSTGLDGKFDFDVQAEMQAGSFSPLPSSVITGVRDLGLQLQPSKAPVKHLIIDKAEKIPTEN